MDSSQWLAVGERLVPHLQVLRPDLVAVAAQVGVAAQVAAQVGVAAQAVVDVVHWKAVPTTTYQMARDRQSQTMDQVKNNQKRQRPQSQQMVHQSILLRPRPPQQMVHQSILLRPRHPQQMMHLSMPSDKL
jgi:hypothetical protein